MRRFRFSLVIAAMVCLAGMIFVPGALAGNFDGDKMGCPGETPNVCPTATAGQSYSLTIYLKPPDGGRGEDFICARFRVDSGNFPAGLSISDEGIISGTPTTAGSYDFYLKVTYDKETSCLATPKPASEDRFIINVNPPVQRLIVSSPYVLPDAPVGQAYSQQLTASGGTVSAWSIAAGSLPPGLTLATNGVLSGTPTQGGTFTFTVQAAGTPNSDTKQLTVFVLAPLEIQSMTGQKPPGGTLTAKRAVNEPLATGVKAAGGRGPYTYSAVGLPAGFTLDATTGAVTGAGTVAGRYTATITTTDATGAKATVQFKFTILPLLQFVKGKGLPAGKVNQAYSARIAVSGKDARTAQFAVSGQIPPGLELDDTGRLTGVLLKAGTYHVRVFAFPANGAPISQRFTIRVRA